MSPINDVKLVVMVYCVVLTVRVYGPGIFSYGPGIFSHVITGGFPRSQKVSKGFFAVDPQRGIAMHTG